MKFFKNALILVTISLSTSAFADSTSGSITLNCDFNRTSGAAVEQFRYTASLDDVYHGGGQTETEQSTLQLEHSNGQIHINITGFAPEYADITLRNIDGRIVGGGKANAFFSTYDGNCEVSFSYKIGDKYSLWTDTVLTKDELMTKLPEAPEGAVWKLESSNAPAFPTTYIFVLSEK